MACWCGKHRRQVRGSACRGFNQFARCGTGDHERKSSSRYRAGCHARCRQPYQGPRPAAFCRQARPHFPGPRRSRGKGAATWAEQLQGIAASIDCFSFDAFPLPTQKPINDLNDFVRWGTDVCKHMIPRTEGKKQFGWKPSINRMARTGTPRPLVATPNQVNFRLMRYPR